MADAALDGLLDQIQHLLLHNVGLVKEAKTQMENLLMDLRLFKASLAEQTSGKKYGRLQKELISQTRNVIYEAEDVVDDFVTQATYNNSRPVFLRSSNRRQALLKFSTQVEDLMAKLNHILSTSKLSRKNMM